MFADLFVKGNDWIKNNKACFKLLDDFGVGVALISPRMEIIALNKVMKKWFPSVKGDKKPICYESFNIPPRKQICSYCPTILTLKDGKIHEATTETPAGDKIVNYRVVSSPVKDKADNIIAAIEVVEDITEHKRNDEERQKTEAKYHTLFEGANDAILIADADTGCITEANRQAEILFGRAREEIIGMHQSELYPSEEAERYQEIFEKFVKENITAGTGEAEVVNKDGMKIPVLMTASVHEIDGHKIVEAIFRDISELKRIEGEKKEAEALALIDPHTQLYNYRYLQRRLHSELELAKRRATPLSLLMIDIDYFKSINDTYGHEFGDVVLREFAILLQHACRGIDVVTRFEGEGFTVILPDTDGRGALAFAEKIQNMIKKHRFGIHNVKMRVSVGVSTYPEDGIATIDSILTNVDKCVRFAKEQGGDTITAYSQLRDKNVSMMPVEQDSQQRVTYVTKKFIELIRRNKQNTIEAVYALARTVGAKNAYTEEHSENMVKYCTEIGKRLGLSDDELEDLKHGAMLHDIGKLGISENILLKRGKLTRKEFEVIKKHPQIGADIVRPVHFLKDVVPIILHHHERYDGYGYGSKLKGDEIPIGARIVAVVDVYQALISNRPYRKAYSKREAIKIIKEESGTHFDPKIVKVFLDILAKGRQKKTRRA